MAYSTICARYQNYILKLGFVEPPNPKCIRNTRAIAGMLQMTVRETLVTAEHKVEKLWWSAHCCMPSRSTPHPCCPFIPGALHCLHLWWGPTNRSACRRLVAAESWGFSSLLPPCCRCFSHTSCASQELHHHSANPLPRFWLAGGSWNTASSLCSQRNNRFLMLLVSGCLTILCSLDHFLIFSFTRILLVQLPAGTFTWAAEKLVSKGTMGGILFSGPIKSNTHTKVLELYFVKIGIFALFH